jgi:PAS domain S-box-containing protein
LAILGYDGCVTRANSAWFGVFGFTAEEVHGRPLVEFLHPDDRTAVEQEFQRLIAGGRDAQFECRGLCKNGSSVWLVVSATASPDEKLIFVAGHDITESKRMTEALDLHAEKLARSNEELERFAYVASHDLQEPLRMVASFTELLGKRYSGQLDETADRYIHFAVDGAKRMQQLIADLLAYSRVNSKELDVQQVDCGEVVQTAMRNLEAATTESGASIRCDTLPWLPADQMQLTQLFQNLLGNAIKFRRTGEPPRVHVSAVDCGAEYVFSVGDNGIGIEPGQVDRIFQVFQRLHTRAEFPGTGIGLAICKKVVERHGGKIWVESTPGIGSTFRFSLPKSQRTG